jgi:hypothetical protein
MKNCFVQKENIPPNVSGKYSVQSTLIGTINGIEYPVTNPSPGLVFEQTFIQNGRFVQTTSKVIKPLIWERNYNKNMCFSGWKLLGADTNDNENFTFSITKMDKCNNVLEMERIGLEAGFGEDPSQTTQMNLGFFKRITM